MNEFSEDPWVRTLTVTTPEQVMLRFETAGIGSRVGAQLIDVLILLAVNAALGLGTWMLVEALPDGLSLLLEEYAWSAVILLFAVLNGGYFVIAEYATAGRTIGKRAMGIRVIQDNGRPLSFLSSVIRNLLRIIDMLPMLYLAGALFSFFHPQDKRLGDIAAGTAVVYEGGGSRRRAKRIEKLLASWEQEMPVFSLDPWVRERVNEEEWALVSGFVERLPYLAPARAGELARGIVELLAPKLGLSGRWSEAEQPADVLQEHAARRRPLAVAWTLALYVSLRGDWELTLPGGEA